MVKLHRRGDTYSARLQLSQEDYHDFNLTADTLKQVQGDVKQVVALVQADISKRFAHVGLARYMYLLDPSWAPPASGRGPGVAEALQQWSIHFACDFSLLEQQWHHISACALTHTQHQPSTLTLHPHDFWPPLLLAHWSAAPDLCRCIGAMIILSWQNAAVERDLAVLTKIRDRAAGRLGMWRLAARCRIAIDGPKADKQRVARLSGVLRTIAKDWFLHRNRHTDRKVCPEP